MYAVFEDGSRQYRVSEGDKVRLDYREADLGTRLQFNRVLLYQGGSETLIGQPVVEGARILAEVVDHPSIKLYIQHFRRRKNYRRLKGHRQPYIQVQIRSILLAGQEPPPPPAKPRRPRLPRHRRNPPPRRQRPPRPRHQHRKRRSRIPGCPPEVLPRFAELGGSARRGSTNYADRYCGLILAIAQS